MIVVVALIGAEKYGFKSNRVCPIYITVHVVADKNGFFRQQRELGERVIEYSHIRFPVAEFSGNYY